jgi:hypothetical protein
MSDRPVERAFALLVSRLRDMGHVVDVDEYGRGVISIDHVVSDDYPIDIVRLDRPRWADGSAAYLVVRRQGDDLLCRPMRDGDEAAIPGAVDDALGMLAEMGYVCLDAAPRLK